MFSYLSVFLPFLCECVNQRTSSCPDCDHDIKVMSCFYLCCYKSVVNWGTRRPTGLLVHSRNLKPHRLGRSLSFSCQSDKQDDTSWREPKWRLLLALRWCCSCQWHSISACVCHSPDGTTETLTISHLTLTTALFYILEPKQKRCNRLNINVCFWFIYSFVGK